MSSDSIAQQTYTAAQAKLMDQDGNPTPHHQAYIRFENEYKNRVKARDDAYADALKDPMKFQNWPIAGKSYGDDINQAMDRWVSLGFKQEIETAIATLSALDSNA